MSLFSAPTFVGCGSLVFFVYVFIGCDFFTDDRSGSGTPRLGRLTVSLQIGSDGNNYQALGKATVILAKVIVTLTPAKGAVLYDTITPNGSQLSREPAYLSKSPEYAQELLLRYEIKPSSRWTIEARVLDTQDSIRYVGRFIVEDMDAFEYLDGCLPVDPRYAVIEGRFRLPAAIESDGIPGSGRGLRALYVTRLTLLVEENILTERKPYSGVAAALDERFVFADPNKLFGSAGVRFFRPSTFASGDGTPIVVSHDYGSILNSHFTIDAYGYVEGDTVGVTPERLLFEGRDTLDLRTAKVSVESPVLMVWKAVDAIAVDLLTEFDVRLGRAGKVEMNVIIPEAVAL
jgi:hypothetical protein